MHLAREELVLQHLHDMHDFTTAEGLLRAHAPPARMRAEIAEVFPTAVCIETSTTYRNPLGAKFGAADVVLLGRAHGNAAATVWYHLKVDEEYWTVVALWARVSVDDHGTAHFQVQRQRSSFVRSADLMEPCIWRLSRAGDVATALLPLAYRLRCARGE